MVPHGWGKGGHEARHYETNSEPIDNLILRHVSGGSNEIYVARSQLAWPICVDSMKCCTDFSTCCLPFAVWVVFTLIDKVQRCNYFS